VVKVSHGAAKPSSIGVSNTADLQTFRTEVTADCSQISMHARPHI